MAGARGALATANQKPGQALAGGRKVAAVQIWRECGFASLLPVYSATCEESLKPCARDVRRSRHRGDAVLWGGEEKIVWEAWDLVGSEGGWQDLRVPIRPEGVVWHLCIEKELNVVGVGLRVL